MVKTMHSQLKQRISIRQLSILSQMVFLSFDRLTNVSFSMTNHEESQPAHLQLSDMNVPISLNLPKYAEPAQRYCPAGVYEVVEEEGQDPRFCCEFPKLRSLQKRAILRTQVRISHG